MIRQPQRNRLTCRWNSSSSMSSCACVYLVWWKYRARTIKTCNLDHPESIYCSRLAAGFPVTSLEINARTAALSQFLLRGKFGTGFGEICGRLFLPGELGVERQQFEKCEISQPLNFLAELSHALLKFTRICAISLLAAHSMRNVNCSAWLSKVNSFELLYNSTICDFIDQEKKAKDTLLWYWYKISQTCKIISKCSTINSVLEITIKTKN